MTRPEAEALILRWDLKAKDKPEIRKNLWRILDALAGWQKPETAIAALDSLAQTKEVEEIREVLGLPMRDAPLWPSRRPEQKIQG